MILDNLQENKNVNNILAVSENMGGRIEKDNNFLEILIIAAKEEDLISLLERYRFKPGKVVISNSIAENFLLV